MFDGIDPDQPKIETLETKEFEIDEETRRRLVAEWTQRLSSLPGIRGRILRTALKCGWS